MLGRINRLLAASLLSAAAVAAVPSAALADHRFETHRDDHRDDHREWRHDDDHGGHLNIRIGGGSYERIPPCPPPVYQETVWVAPVYRSCTEQVLVPATYTTVVDRVWVDGHYEDRPRPVLLCAAHYEIVTRQELIAPGHYETINCVAAVHPARDEFNFGLRIPLGR